MSDCTADKMDLMRGRPMLRGLRNVGLAVAFGVAMAGLTLPAGAAGDAPQLESQSWSFDGIFGTYDRGALQRGFKVYKEVCASCHGMKLLHYRNLGEPGGPGFSAEQVKAIAASVEVPDGPNEEGDMFERPGLPRDAFVSPFPNDNAARASNGGALPPDLSVMAKARPNGPDYIYALLTTYKEEAPEGFELQEGMYYNAAFAGHQIAMAPPLSDDAIEYDDGTPATVANLAKDVTTFMMWAAEPKLEERKRMGFNVIIYLIVLSGLLYFTTKKLWAPIKE